MSRVDLLVVDDFGLKPLKSPQDEDIHDLIAERYERTSTIVTSNLAFPSGERPFQTVCSGPPRSTACATGASLASDAGAEPSS